MTTQYTIFNNTDIVLYLNSKEIAIKPGDKRWFYFDVFDCRYVLSSVGFLILGHRYDKLYIEHDGQLNYKIDKATATVYVTRECEGKDKDCCKTCKWFNKGLKNMAYCAQPSNEVLTGNKKPNPDKHVCDKFEEGE